MKGFFIKCLANVYYTMAQGQQANTENQQQNQS
jgi:hypothetical protein